MNKTIYLLAAATVASGPLFGGAVITTTGGTVALGINDEGHLNFTGGITPENSSGMGLSIWSDVGPSGTTVGAGYYDSTSPGCFCEGWGVAANGESGYANVSTDGGVNNLTLDSFTSTANTATSSVRLASLPDLTVSQAYAPAPAASEALFENVVTITNNSTSTMTDIRYVRVMDWDIPFNEFNENVSIIGTGTTSDLAVSHNDGFDTANPLVATSGRNIGTPTDNVDFTDAGPTDHGAYFRFDFGDLAAGESKTFSVFYGAAYSEADMLAALGDVGIELYSLGQSDVDPSGGTPFTFAFGFKGVGGQTVLPPSNPIPEPSTYGMMGLAIVGALLYLRNRRKKSVLQD